MHIYVHSTDTWWHFIENNSSLSKVTEKWYQKMFEKMKEMWEISSFQSHSSFSIWFAIEFFKANVDLSMWFMFYMRRMFDWWENIEIFFFQFHFKRKNSIKECSCMNYEEEMAEGWIRIKCPLIFDELFSVQFSEIKNRQLIKN